MFTQIFITPKPLLLAQKFYEVLNRPISKGRDFFDIVFLLSLEYKPDYDYLNFKTGIHDTKTLKERIFHKCESLDIEEMARDVAPLLFNLSDSKKDYSFYRLYSPGNLIKESKNNNHILSNCTQSFKLKYSTS